jgi:hypothetical protein
MKRESNSSRGLAPIVVGAALSALAMYMLDPDRGRRRRALVRDKVRSAVTGSADWLDMAARDISFRAQGLRAMALRSFRPKEVPDDLALIERVRARMGRVVSHPHALQIGARLGRVVLSGPILASEADALLDAVRSVEGVSEVEDHLVIHERPGSIPSLQGGVPRSEMRAALVQDNWSPSLRFAAMVGGGLLALYGMRQRTATRFVLAGVGLGLAARGAANVPLSRVAGVARQQLDDDVDRMNNFIERGLPPHDASRPEASQPQTSPLH